MASPSHEETDTNDSSRYVPRHEEHPLRYPMADSGEYDMIDDLKVETFDDEGSVDTVSSTGATDQSNADTVDSIDRCDDEIDDLDERFTSSTSHLPDRATDEEHIPEPDEAGSAELPEYDTDVEGEDSIQESEVTIKPSASGIAKIEDDFSQPAKPVASSRRFARLGLPELAICSFPKLNTFSVLKFGGGSLVILITLLSYALLFTSTIQIDPATEMAIRREALSNSLRTHMANFSVKAEDILHYPSNTIANGSVISTKLAFPSQLAVHAARSDQLFVSLPKEKGGYPKDARVGVFKDGRTLHNVNRTHLIAGIVHLALDPLEANGNLNISVLSGRQNISFGGINLNPPGETRCYSAKVNLGSRLLHRATYHNAATQVHQSVRREVFVGHRVLQSIQSEILTSLYSDAAVVGNWSMSVLGQVSTQASRTLNGTTSTANKMIHFLQAEPAKINRRIRRALPEKPDVTAHLKRAQSNARAIQRRISGVIGFTKAPARAESKVSEEGKLAYLQSCVEESLDAALKSLNGIWKRIDTSAPSIKATDRSRATKVRVVKKQPLTREALQKGAKAAKGKY